MTNKNPYEIRLDVMKMAQDMLEKEYSARLQKFQTTVDVMREDMIQNRHYQGNNLQEFIEKNSPNPYTTEQVVSKANELYSFVSASTRTSRDQN